MRKRELYDVTSLIAGVFDLSGSLFSQGGPGADRRGRAALRRHRPVRRRDDRRTVRAARRRAEGARRRRQGGDGPGRGDPPPERPAADAAPLRPGPVPGTRGRYGRPRPCTSDGSASPTAPAAGCSSTGVPRRRNRSSRRRTPGRWVWRAAAGYRWSGGRITDYWDEVFTAEGLEGHAALDDQSAFIASLGGNRLAPDAGRARDDPVRPGRHHPRGFARGPRRRRRPGYGKTVVALHRTAHLLYSDPRLGHRRGGVCRSAHQP
ncbi:AAA family ATPase [Streptomyces tanashiensis]